MEKKETTIEFITDDGQTVVFDIISETKINGTNYLLATEDGNDDETYIMKESNDEGSNIVYDIVEDEKELHAIASVFEELLEDIDIE